MRYDMEHAYKNDVVNRLKSIAGHVNGITTMVEQDRYCIDVAHVPEHCRSRR